MNVRNTKKEFKEVETVIEDYDVCDKCEERIHTDCFDAFDFDLELKTGSSYPEGGSGESQTMDLCPNCAEMLISFLKDNGFRINTKEWDF